MTIKTTGFAGQKTFARLALLLVLFGMGVTTKSPLYVCAIADCAFHKRNERNALA